MRSLLPLAASAFLTLCSVAHANTINVYNLNATLVTGTVAGTVTLDATTGKFTDANFSVLTTYGNASFTDAPTTVSPQATYNRNIFSNSNPLITFTLDLPVTSLVNYAGGSLCTQNSLCAANTSSAGLVGVGTDNVTAGMLTLFSTTAPTGSPAPAAVTPEPGSLILLGTGVLAIGGMMRRRRI